MWVRDAGFADTAALADVFYRAVQIGAAPAYDQAQRDAWCRVRPSTDGWTKRLDGLLTLVAEGNDGIVGFMSLRMDDGYLDLAFVDPDVRRAGVAADIYAVLENRARVAGLGRLHSHASTMAKGFFERQGWRVVQEQNVERGGVVLDNWAMEKQLSAQS